MYFRKTFAVILMVMIFIGSTGLIQGSDSTKSTTKKIVLDHYEISIAAGQTIKVKAIIKSDTKQTVEQGKLVWKSDSLASVQVNAQGDIKALKPSSKAVITVSSADKKLKATCKVTVMSEHEAASCIAIIDNVKVTNQEYLLYSKANIAQFLASNAITTTADKYNWKTKINNTTAKEQVKKVTLDNILEIKIQLIKAKATGIKLDDKDLKSIEDSINQLIADRGGKEAAEKAIRATYGVSVSEFKKAYTEISLTQKYINSERSKITIPDSEVKKYYEDNKENNVKATVTHILLSTVDNTGVPVSADKKAVAKKKADDLLAKVNAGEDIKALAEKNSEDPGVVNNKGEYTFGKGEMVTEFEEWAFSHSAGDTGIVETSYGYHVMKLEKREEQLYEDVKETIKASLVALKLSEDFTKNMNSWKKESQFAIWIITKSIEKVDKSLYK